MIHSNSQVIVMCKVQKERPKEVFFSCHWFAALHKIMRITVNPLANTNILDKLISFATKPKCSGLLWLEVQKQLRPQKAWKYVNPLACHSIDHISDVNTMLKGGLQPTTRTTASMIITCKTIIISNKQDTSGMQHIW